MTRRIIGEADYGSRLKTVGNVYDIRELVEPLIAARAEGVMIQVLIDEEDRSPPIGLTEAEDRTVRALLAATIEVRWIDRGGDEGPPGFNPFERYLWPRGALRFSSTRATWSDYHAVVSVGRRRTRRSAGDLGDMAVEIRLGPVGREQLNQGWSELWDVARPAEASERPQGRALEGHPPQGRAPGVQSPPSPVIGNPWAGMTNRCEPNEPEPEEARPGARARRVA